MHILLYGATGFVGEQMLSALTSVGHLVTIGHARLDQSVTVLEEVRKIQPDRIVCAAGRSHGPGCGSIDYLEDKLPLNLQDNLLGPLNLIMISQTENIHCTLFGTGCIFTSRYDESTKQPVDYFLEDDVPNYYGSSYSVVKGVLDQFCHHPCVKHALLVRIRMPIVNFESDRCFIRKIVKYTHIHSENNSMSYLPNLIPLLVRMIQQEETGVVNLCNPGVINHNDILTRYKEKVNPLHTWTLIQPDDLPCKAGRSNNALDTSRLESLFPDEVLSISDAVNEALATFQRPQDRTG